MESFPGVDAVLAAMGGPTPYLNLQIKNDLDVIKVHVFLKADAPIHLAI